jgi:hypothetical protein
MDDGQMRKDGHVRPHVSGQMWIRMGVDWNPMRLNWRSRKRNDNTDRSTHHVGHDGCSDGHSHNLWNHTLFKSTLSRYVSKTAFDQPLNPAPIANLQMQ